MSGEFKLIRADDELVGYSNPVVNLATAVLCLGAFGSVICIFMILMSYISGGNSRFDAKYLAASAAVFIVCISVTVVLGIFDKRKRKEYLSKQKQLKKNAKRYKGKIIGVEKNVRHVKYMNDVFDDVVWNFVIVYINDDGEQMTVRSNGYLNDISQALTKRSVSVYVKEDGSLDFGSFKLRNSSDEEFVKLKVRVIEKDARV